MKAPHLKPFLRTASATCWTTRRQSRKYRSRYLWPAGAVELEDESVLELLPERQRSVSISELEIENSQGVERMDVKRTSFRFGFAPHLF